MDITEYKTINGESLIEIDFISPAIAWLNESITQNMSKEEVFAWCENFYQTQKLSDEEMDSLRKRAVQHKKMVPQDFFVRLTLSCEILAKLIHKDLEEEKKGK